jgi:hypothetical protein
MAVTIDQAGADTYFGERNHVRSDLWSRFNEDQKVAAIAHATRQVSRELNAEVTSETVDAATYYHPDWAVYEQALFLLMNSYAIPNAEETAPHYAAVDLNEADGIKKPDTSQLTDEAARFLLRPKRQIYLVRG